MNGGVGGSGVCVGGGKGDAWVGERGREGQGARLGEAMKQPHGVPKRVLIDVGSMDVDSGVSRSREQVGSQGAPERARSCRLPQMRESGRRHQPRSPGKREGRGAFVTGLCGTSGLNRASGRRRVGALTLLPTLEWGPPFAEQC